MVVEATDAGGKPVAVKILRAGRRTAALEARFAREARIAHQLAGEHLARVDAFGHTDAGDPFLVMELLSGRDLAAELSARGPLPVAEAVDAILEACAGVAEAHAVGLVHRDLKPANLFVAVGVSRPSRSISSIKVLDFGLTSVPHEKGQIDLAATEANFGTPQYMAPEQIRPGSPVDARTDQHALAAVLHELLTGRPPVRGARRHPARRRHRRPAGAARPRRATRRPACPRRSHPPRARQAARRVLPRSARPRRGDRAVRRRAEPRRPPRRARRAGAGRGRHHSPRVARSGGGDDGPPARPSPPRVGGQRAVGRRARRRGRRLPAGDATRAGIHPAAQRRRRRAPRDHGDRRPRATPVPIPDPQIRALAPAPPCASCAPAPPTRSATPPTAGAAPAEPRRLAHAAPAAKPKRSELRPAPIPRIVSR